MALPVFLLYLNAFMGSSNCFRLPSVCWTMVGKTYQSPFSSTSAAILCVETLPSLFEMNGYFSGFCMRLTKFGVLFGGVHIQTPISVVLRIADTSVLRGVPISVVCMPLRGAEPPPYAADALRCAASKRAPIDVGGSFLPADWRCMVGTHTVTCPWVCLASLAVCRALRHTFLCL